MCLCVVLMLVFLTKVRLCCIQACFAFRAIGSADIKAVVISHWIPQNHAIANTVNLRVWLRNPWMYVLICRMLLCLVRIKILAH